eukprot:2627938-Amphidinium_carterae.1
MLQASNGAHTQTCSYSNHKKSTLLSELGQVWEISSLACCHNVKGCRCMKDRIDLAERNILNR